MVAIHIMVSRPCALRKVDPRLPVDVDLGKHNEVAAILCYLPVSFFATPGDPESQTKGDSAKEKLGTDG